MSDDILCNCKNVSFGLKKIMGAIIQIEVNNKLYLKNPESTELGKNIIDNSIKLIEKLGFEKFTFKKLSSAIGCTEASIYRYFENKHKLLIYLVAWYWNWLEYQLDYQTKNVNDAKEKLRIGIKVLSESMNFDPDFSHIDESTLSKIVISESSKAYLTKEVDNDDEEGFFQGYKNLCNRVVDIIQELNPKYKTPKALVSTIIETAHTQIFFANHLQSITDLKVKDNDNSQINDYLEHLVFSVIS